MTGKSIYISSVVLDHILITIYLLNNQLSNANPPLIDYSHNMRILRIPKDTKVNTIIYRLKASDADNEELEFGVRGVIGKRLLDIRKATFYEADVYLKSPLEVILCKIYFIVNSLLLLKSI